MIWVCVLSAKFSEADDNGEKHIIPCRAILGNVEKVVTGSQHYYPSGIEFYTGADDPKNHPKCYVVWSSVMNRHIIPECVVSFKSSINVPVKFWFLVFVSIFIDCHFSF